MNNGEIVTSCIDEVLSGQNTLEDCLNKYPELAEEIRFSLAVAMQLQSQRVDISPDFKNALRNRLLTYREPLLPQKSFGSILDWLTPARMLRVPATALLVIIGLIGGGTTLVYASQGSMPGDVLYPVKIGTENVRLTFTVTHESKAEFNLQIADRRIEEVVAQSMSGQDIDADVPQDVARHLDAAIKEIEELDEEQSKAVISQLSQTTINQQVALSQAVSESTEKTEEAEKTAIEETLDASRRGSTVAVIAEANPAFLTSSPSTADKNIEESYFNLQGTLLSTIGSNWNVAGITLKNVSLPPGSEYDLDCTVTLEGIIRGDNTYISRFTEDEDSRGSDVIIEGIFKGIDNNGNWVIGGISVKKPENISPVPEGSQLKLTGVIQNGIFLVARQEIGDVRKEVRITGKLVEVNKDITTVAIDIAGAKISVRLREVSVVTDSGKGLEKSVLRSLIGKQIQLGELRISSGAISSGKIYISSEILPKTTTETSDKEPDGDRDSDRDD